MEHRELQELIPGHALDGLDPHEAGLLDEHLAGCAACAAELASLREVTAGLAFAAPAAAPPARLRAAVLAAASASAPAPAAAPRRRPVVWRGAALAAAGACLVLAALALTLWGRVDELRRERDSQAAALAALDQRGARLTALNGSAGGSVVGSPGGRAVLVLPALEPAPPGRTYEAWLIGRDRIPRPAATFAGGGLTVAVLHGAVAPGVVVAITVEPVPGSPRPTTHPIASATL